MPPAKPRRETDRVLSMKISINGKTTNVQSNILADAIAEYGATPPYALAVNGEFVPKSDYQLKYLDEHDQVDIVSPIFGG